MQGCLEIQAEPFHIQIVHCVGKSDKKLAVTICVGMVHCETQANVILKYFFLVSAHIYR